MKKLSIALLTIVLAGCTTSTTTQTAFNFTDEMKIEDNQDLSAVDGADSVEREGDHQDSPYFTSLDYYNMESTDTLSILTNFKTIQQSAEWSCGVASALMVMEYQGTRGDLGEEDLAVLRSNGLTPGATSVSQMIDIFEGVGGYTIESSNDYTVDEIYEVFPIERFKEEIDAGNPIMVCWIEWGGHWQVVIGYDDMGTQTTIDDVIIMADPYDTTDHNQDGYMIYGAERFYYNWSMYDFFDEEEERDFLFVIATVEES